MVAIKLESILRHPHYINKSILKIFKDQHTIYILLDDYSMITLHILFVYDMKVGELFYSVWDTIMSDTGIFPRIEGDEKDKDKFVEYCTKHLITTSNYSHNLGKYVTDKEFGMYESVPTGKCSELTNEQIVSIETYVEKLRSSIICNKLSVETSKGNEYILNTNGSFVPVVR